MSSSSTSVDQQDDGMRYRGHHHNIHDEHTNTSASSSNTNTNTNNNNNNLSFDLSKPNNNSSSQIRKSQSNKKQSNMSIIESGNQNQNNNNDDEDTEKPLLAHDYSEGDESTNRGVDSSSSSTNNNNNVSSSSTSLITTIASIARKVRCKVLDKLPVSFATRFAVPSPPDHRIVSLRRFLEHHVTHVATAAAEEQGLTPRQKHHIDMIKALWDRLNTRAPRCVRRRVGEEDEDLCEKTLTGKIWGSFGFQGKDLATDLRGSGQLALEHMLYFVTKHPRTLEAIAATPPDHSPITAHYPFAVASINISMMLIDMIKTVVYAKPQQTPENTNTASAYSPVVSASNFNNNKNTSNSNNNNKSETSFAAATAAPAPQTQQTPATPSSTTSSTPSSPHSTTGAFHIGTYSAIEARRKLCHFLTDPGSVWHAPDGPASSAVTNMNWTHKHFKKQLDSTMDELFGTAVGEAQHRTQEAARMATMTAEEQEMEQISERLAAVYVACCCMLHDQWLQGKRNVMYFNEVFKQTAARTELLFRDSNSFAQVMNAVWKDY